MLPDESVSSNSAGGSLGSNLKLEDDDWALLTPGAVGDTIISRHSILGVASAGGLEGAGGTGLPGILGGGGFTAILVDWKLCMGSASKNSCAIMNGVLFDSRLCQ